MKFMPFYPSTGLGEGTAMFIQQVGDVSPSPTLSLQISTDQLTLLKERYTKVRDSVRRFVDEHGYMLRGAPLAADSVSQQTATAFKENAEAALSVTELFLKELESNMEQLAAAIATYDEAEEGNRIAMQQTGK
ncbi:MULTISPECIES: PE domain-containing protein [Actinosynnema]|uniref:PE domain-containing protein n=1 Tax=Actinosynnema TaxID=40566 RepID=UPI0020A56729|nr:PE domain-containing protein [Actinosynnema pretiosum]MCP2095471.1 PE family protein [Actinosynnema pretiosum]